jgi:undecaprenyl-diphosphatase
MHWPDEVRALIEATDIAGCDAVAGTATPRLDRVLVGVSNAANYSKLWLATAAAAAVGGGGRGRRAACQGVLAIALTSTVTNLILKPLARRNRPARSAGRPVPDSRRVRRPVSPSFPSGHAASAFAFASAMGHAAPGARLPLRVAAATVAYSRVHTGVHYPSDVAIGAVIGDLCGWAVGRLVGRVAWRPGGRGDRDAGHQ